jgi:hypothetical protein
MLVCMDPSSPPVLRTFHLLKTPDILCANDNRLSGNYYLVNNRAWLRYTRQVGMWELMPLQARDYLGHGDKLALQLAVKIREFTLGVGWLLGP